VIGTYTTTGNGKAIASDTHALYFTTSSGTLFSCPKSGCGSSPVVLSSGLLAPYSLAYDPDIQSLWLDEWAAGSVDSFSRAGALELQITGQSPPSGVAFDSTSVYWGTTSTIEKSTKDGQTQTTIAAGLPSGVNAIALDEGLGVVFAALQGDSGAIVTAPISGNGTWSYFAGTSAHAQGNPVAIVVQSPSVYWINAGTSANAYQDGGLFSCDVLGCSAPQSMTASPFAYGAAVIADSTSVYFGRADTSGVQINRCPLRGCGSKPAVIATGQTLMSGQTLTQDTTAIYWVEAQNDVMGLAK
jgi:hypothetical protein